MLDDRKAAVLRELVEEYIRTGEPVSSRAIVECGLDCSSATVRNELAVLEGDGFIKDWLLSGPHFKAGVARGEMLDWTFAPEVDPRLAGWQAVDASDMPNGIIDLKKFMDGDNRCAYLGAVLVSEEETDRLLRVGSDDAIKVWLNGKTVHRNDANRPVKPDQDTVRVRIEKGPNPLLVKVGQNSGDWGACVRLE